MGGGGVVRQTWDKKWGGVHRAHLEIPVGMVVRGGRRQNQAVHMPSCVARVTKELLVSIERTLAYPAVGVVLGKSVRSSCGGRKGGGYQWLG